MAPAAEAAGGGVMETGCICSSLGPCKEHSPDFDVCECGDYRCDHEDGSGYCRMPNNLCHAFKECLVFRISQRADGLPIHPDTTTINALRDERDTLAKRVEDSEDEARVLRDELSHIADALGVAPSGGCYEQAEVLERAKVLAKRVEELEEMLCEYKRRGYGEITSRNIDVIKEADAIATRRAGRTS